MKKIIAIGLTDEAYKDLNDYDIELLESCLPSECALSKEVNDNGDELIYFDNLSETVYKGYLIFE